MSDVVLVTGPPLAGTSSLAAALRPRLPEWSFVESGDAPVAVLFVVSAAAPVAESDCLLAESAAAGTELVIGVVSKVDAHRGWREMLAVNHRLLAARVPRYRETPWVGTAAAPDLGEPILDDLTRLLRVRLADAGLHQRNLLRANESRLVTEIGRYHALRTGRDELVRRRRRAATEYRLALRSRIQQARVQLSFVARNRCTAVRAEWQDDLAGLGRRHVRGFESHVRDRCGDIVAEIDDEITDCVWDVAAELGLPAPPGSGTSCAPALAAAPLRTRGPETRLTAVLGAGFGLGVALAVSRLFAGFAPQLTVAGLAAGGLAGLLLTVWVAGTRSLLHDRAVLDRWLNEVTAALRSTVEQSVATRVLAAETLFTTAASTRDQMQAAETAERIAAIDAQLRVGRLASLERELTEVRTQLLAADVTPL